MESDINALAHSCRELLPIIDIKISLGKAVGLPIGDTKMNVYIHEDNAGALILAKNIATTIHSVQQILCVQDHLVL